MTWWPSTRRTHIVNKQFTNVALISSLCAPPHTIRTILTIHHRLCIQLVSSLLFIYVSILLIYFHSWWYYVKTLLPSSLSFLFFFFRFPWKFLSYRCRRTVNKYTSLNVHNSLVCGARRFPSDITTGWLSLKMKYDATQRNKIIAKLIYQQKKPTVPGSDSISRRNPSWTWNSFANLNV